MFLPDLISALGWTLLHSLWQGSLLFLFLVPLLQLLRDRSPQLRYGIACGALLLLVAGMAVTFSWQWEKLPAAAPATTSVAFVPEIAPAAAPELSPLAVAQPSLAPAAAPVKEAFSWSHFLEANVGYLALAWGLGAVIFALRWCSILLLTHRLRKRGTSTLTPVWTARLAELKQRMG
ncbi:MAG: hypothetical protein AAFZ52_16450, partial [Bacteroidota bacterium]